MNKKNIFTVALLNIILKVFLNHINRYYLKTAIAIVFKFIPVGSAEYSIQWNPLKSSV